jgi:serine/threonine-protein kinase
VGAIFDAALGLDPDEREGFVRDRAGDDAALADEVLSLLEAHDGPGPIGRLADPMPGAPDRTVGQYRLVELLGIGGMGAVYLAERRGEDFTQRVALKLIRAGFIDPRLEARLLEERRILARLEHPGIARFIDGGTTGSGQSYIAMEYVPGTSLLRYCTERHAPLPSRLALFLRVCEAVQFAHQRLVVHGDLKPDNIFVTEEGRTKLLDFGIAELAEPRESRSSERTVPWLTPAYASPEQILGHRLTPTDDVYALGVILHELLAGVRPYETDGLSPAELQKVICEVVPPPASRVAQSVRDRRFLQGDLDLIISTALAKDTDHRYPSVQHLADDLQRYLERRPILARKASPSYRIGKFVDRHRVSVVAASLVTVSLVSATVVSVTQARQAEQARQRAVTALNRSESVSSFLISLFQSSDPMQLSEDTLVARAVLTRGLARVDELAGQPEVQARLLDALGNVLVSLDELEQGRTLLERALALRREVLGNGHPEVLATLRSLTRARRFMGHFPEALAHAEEALRLQRAAGAPADSIAVSLGEVAFMLPYVGRTFETDSLYREVVSLMRREHGENDPRVAAALLRVGSSQRRIGLYAAAESSYKQAHVINQQQLGPDDWATAFSKIAIADLAAFERPSAGDAEQLYREAIATLERVRSPDHIDLIHPLGNLAEVLMDRGRPREAEQLWRRQLEIRMRHFGSEHTATAGSEEGVAIALHGQGRYAEAEELMRSAFERRLRLHGPNHPSLGAALVILARLREERGAYREAEEAIREAIRNRRHTFGERGQLVVLAEAQLAGLLARRGELAEARRLLENSITVQLERTLPTHRDARLTYKRLADLHARLGNAAERERYAQLAGDVK